MRVVWEVSPGVHPTADSLGDLSGLAMDTSGNVYASDFLAVKVWVFDRTGRSRASFGRKGEGPGEFQAPTGIAIGPDGRLYVRDIYRVSRFGPDLSTDRLTNFEDSFNGPVYADWTSKRATRFDASGNLLYPGTRWSIGEPPKRFFLRYNREGELQDTIRVPAYPEAPGGTVFVRTSPGGGPLLRGLNHVPFAPLHVWDVTPAGTVISGDARSYDLQETASDGRVLRSFRRDIPLDRIPTDERRDSLRALRRRIDSIPVPLNQVEGMPEEVRRLDLPNLYPAYMAVYVGIDSTVWVRRWSAGAQARSVFDVFAKSGDFLGTVILPRIVSIEPTPILTITDVVAVAIDPDTDESILLRFQRQPSR